MNNYVFPLIIGGLFLLLLAVNVYIVFRDYKQKLLIETKEKEKEEVKHKKISLLPNTMIITLILIGIGLTIYEFYLIYSQLHEG